MARFIAHGLRAPALIAALSVAAAASGCVSGSSSSSTFAPTPLIVPDAVTLPIGAAQVFDVLNATVERFDVSGDRGWASCVAVDLGVNNTNSIRLVARQRCEGLVYVSARIGPHRSPLVAVIRIP